MRSLEKIDLKIRWFQEKIAEYQVRLQELQKKRTEVENMEILQTVHEVAATPEEIRQILEQIRSVKGLETAESQMKEEPKDEKEDDKAFDSRCAVFFFAPFDSIAADGDSGRAGCRGVGRITHMHLCHKMQCDNTQSGLSGLCPRCIKLYGKRTGSAEVFL